MDNLDDNVDDDLPIRNNLSLWWSGEPQVLFVYYLTGAITLSFLFLMMVTKALRRIEACVIEATRDGVDELGEEEDYYMIAITTSLSLGHECPDNVKVLVQLQGEFADSRFFIVKSNQGNKSVFKRGFTDIFLLRITDMLGKVEKLRIVVSGITNKIKWTIKKVELYELKTGLKTLIPTVVMTTEVMDEPDITDDVLQTSTSCCGKLTQCLFRYHQWLAMYGNPMRFGAFTEVVHVLMFFTAFITLLTSSLVLYIVFPRSTEESLDIHIESLLISAPISAGITAGFCLILEILLRNIKSNENLQGDSVRTLNRLKHGKASMRKRYQNLVSKPAVNLMYRFDPDRAWNYRHDPMSQSEKAIKDSERREKVSEICNISRGLFPGRTGGTGARVHPVSSNEMQNAKSGRGGICGLRGPCMPQGSDVRRVVQESDPNLPKEYRRSHDFAAHVLESATTPEQFVDGMLEMFPSRGKKKRSVKKGGAAGMSDFVKSHDVQSAIAGSTEVPGLFGSSHSKVKDLLKGCPTPEVFVESMSDYHQCKYVHDPEEEEEKDREFEAVFKIHHANLEGEGDNLEGKSIPIVRATVLSKQKGKGCLQRNTSQPVCDTELQAQLRIDMRRWSRNFVRDLALTMKKNEASSAEGSLSYSEGSISVLRWVHDLVHRICICMVANKRPYNENIFQFQLYPEVVSLVFHLSAEILLLAMQGVCKLLADKESSMLAEMMIQSHFLMQSVKKASESVIRCVKTLNKGYGDAEVMSLFRYMDVETDLKLLARELIQDCAGLSLQGVFIPWQLIQNLCKPQSGESLEHVTQKLTSLVVLAAKNELEEEAVDHSFVSRICDHLVIEAKRELWMEYQSQKMLYVDMLVKKEVLNHLKQRLTKLQKKEKIVEEVDPVLAERETHLQRLERRRQISSSDPSIADPLNNPPLKCKKGAKAAVSTVLDPTIIDPLNNPPLKSKVSDAKPAAVQGASNSQGSEKKSTLKRMGFKVLKQTKMDHGPTLAQRVLQLKEKDRKKQIALFTKLHDELRRRWNRMGFRSSVPADRCLAQALIHPLIKDPWNNDISLDGFTEGTLRFENILQLKYKEVKLASSLSGVVEPKVKYFLHSTYSKHETAMIDGQENDFAFHQAVEDIVVHVDQTSQWMTNQIETMVWNSLADIRRLQKKKKWVDIEDILRKRSLNKQVVDIFQGTNAAVSSTTTAPPDQTQKGTVAKGQDTYVTVEEDKLRTSFQDIILDLKPIHVYLRYTQEEEIIRHQVTMRNYIQRLKQKREQFCTINLQNIIDSFFLVEDIADTRKLNVPTRYQLEHEVMEESNRLIPGFVKTLIMSLLFLFIGLSIAYDSLIPGQFSTEELQEWICYFLLSLAEFAFVVEPIRAILVGLLVRRAVS